jgi:hypothetical protein
MLFQASALAHAPFETPPRALTAPALGRVAPVAVEVAPEELMRSQGEQPFPLPPRPTPPTLESHASVASFWPLVKVELAEAGLLVLLQVLSLGLPAWLLGISPMRLLSGAWLLMVPYLFCVSWAFFMVPLVLTGQSPCMAPFGVTLAENNPDRRMAFSLLHLLSVCCFPLSFLAMVLGPRHQTLAELLSGQELLAKPTDRLR